MCYGGNHTAITAIIMSYKTTGMRNPCCEVSMFYADDF